PSLPDKNHRKILWLVRLRWLALLFQLCMLPFVIAYGWINESFIFFYLITLGNTFLLNLICSFLLKKIDWFSNGFVFFNLCVDLCAFLFLLMLTGGAWNPLLPLVFFHAALGAILLNGLLRLSFCLCLILGLLTLHLNPNTPPAIAQGPMTNYILIPVQIFVSLAIFIVITRLSSAILLHQSSLERLQQEKNRIDHLRALGALASGFSHEFATPLNTIKLRLGRLSRKHSLENNEDILALTKALEQCENTLQHMVGKGFQRENIRFVKTDMVPLIRRICEQWSSRRRTTDIEFIQGNHGEMKSHQQHHQALYSHIPILPFTKAFLDLLDNAEQACRINSQEEKIRVKINIESQSKYIGISVIDDGPGWPAIVKNLVGEPFVTTKPMGTGLGLYNANSLATAVGGLFSLKDSPYGKGATAHLLIPTCSEKEEFF
ncbi:MAG: HAMP domain-containing histidine kinase, partial [Silvanigrellaceae bacterium]|nr:HAMP domain-containing histidine kinase [Silvanigrellaceae bacterium]